MTFVSCSVPERFVNPLFEVFDGGDFILSSYHDIEEKTTLMRIFFENPAETKAAKRCLAAALRVVGCRAQIAEGDMPDEDWKLAYRRHFKTEKVGRRLLVVPEWEFDGLRASSRIPIVLDPGMAFGTGKHETTRACLEYIDELSRSAGSGGTFLDMGCGSGILSIAAAKLGFRSVAGFDIDEDAVTASRENAAKNGVRVKYRVFALGNGAVTLDASIEAAKGLYPDLALQGKKVSAKALPFKPADFVVANILGPLLIAFADEIAGYAKRDLVVSGILNELYPEVCAAFEARGFREVSRKTLGEWSTGHLRRENAPDLAPFIDHTFLKPAGEKDAVRKLCREAREAGFASVCVNPCEVELCARLLKGSTTKVCTVIDFPLGASTLAANCAEAAEAMKDGASELDLVVNQRLLKFAPAACGRDLAAFVACCRRRKKGVVLKLILECCNLTKAEIVRGCKLAKRAGFDFVKTSTGFAAGGATVEDVALMRKTVGPKMGVKAAGGIRDRATALRMIAAGATRLGCSAGLALLKEGAS